MRAQQNREPSLANVQGAGPIQILREAIRAVPAVKYALGVAGIAAAVAIILGFHMKPEIAFFGTVIVIGLMFVLVTFSRYAGQGHSHLIGPAILLAWFFTLALMATTTLLMTSYFIHWPPIQRRDLNTTHEGKKQDIEDSQQPASTHLDAAKTLDDNGNYSDALSEYRLAVRDNPQSAEAHHGICDMKGRLCDVKEGGCDKPSLSEGLHECQEALKLDPTSAITHKNLGDIYSLMAGDEKKAPELELAVSQYNEALRLDPNMSSAYDWLGVIANRQEDYQRAIKQFSRELQLDPDSFAGHLGLSFALQNTKPRDLDGALRHIRKALDIKPKAADAWNQLGIILDDMGDEAGALEGYRNAHLYDPSSKTYRENYEQTLKDLNK